MTSQKQGEESIQDSRTDTHKKIFEFDYDDNNFNETKDSVYVEVEEPMMNDENYNSAPEYIHENDEICHVETNNERGDYSSEKSEHNMIYHKNDVEEYNVNIDDVEKNDNVDTEFSKTEATETLEITETLETLEITATNETNEITEANETTECSTNLELEIEDQNWMDDQSDDEGEDTNDLDDDKSTTTQSVVLNSAIESTPSLVQTMLHSSSWYNAFLTMESRSQGSGLKTGEDEDDDEGDKDGEGNGDDEGEGDHSSCVNSIMSADRSDITSSSDPLANFTDYQLFRLQQYRIDELNEQLEKVRASVSEYHNLLDRFQTIQDENFSLKKRVKEVEEELKISEQERQEEKLKQAEIEISRDLAEEIIELKLSLAEAQTYGDCMNKANAERIKTLEDTVVKLKMELADCKSKEDWARLKPSRFFRS